MPTGSLRSFASKMPDGILSGIFARDMRGYRIAAVVISLYLSAAVVLDTTIEWAGIDWAISKEALFPGGWPRSFGVSMILEWLAIAAVIWFCMLVVAQIVARGTAYSVKESGENSRSGYFRFVSAHKKAAGAAFALIMVFWLILLAVYFPGASMNDQITIVDNPWGNASVHPVIYVFPLAWFVQLSNDLFQTGNIGFAAFVVLQMVFSATIATLCIMWLAYRKAPRWVCVIAVLFFALNPVVADYAITSIKDTPFAYALLLLMPIMYELFDQGPQAFFAKRGHCVCLIVACMLVGITRNNGPYIVCSIAVIVLVMAIRGSRIREGLCVVVLSVALAFAPNAIADRALGIQHQFSESLSIPLQQLAAVQCLDGTMSDAEAEFIGHVFMPGAAKRNYCPGFADPVKLNLAEKVIDVDYIQAHRLEFMTNWLSIGLKNPVTYIKAWLAETYGCWSLSAPNSAQSYFQELSANTPGSEYWDGLVEQVGLKNDPLLPDRLAGAMMRAHGRYLTCPSPGALFAAMLVLAFIAMWREKKTAAMATVAPGVLLWLTLFISTPLSTALRYGFLFLIALPVLAGMCGFALDPKRKKELSS